MAGVYDWGGVGALGAGAAGGGMCAGRVGAGVRRPGSGAGRSAADPIRPVLVCPPGQARPGAAGPGGNGRDVRDAGDPPAGLRPVVLPGQRAVSAHPQHRRLPLLTGDNPPPSLPAPTLTPPTAPPPPPPPRT